MSFIAELKRRNVFRMAALYVVAAWLVMQVAEVLLGLGDLPVWMGRATIAILAVGFPIALILSWIFEITPEGLKLEKDVVRGESITSVTGRRMDFVVIGMLSAAVVLFAVDKWWAFREPALAILPCANLSNDPDNGAFVAGLHDQMVSAASAVSGMVVISRTSVEQFRDHQETMPGISHALGVSHVLECGIQRTSNLTGDRILVNVQLVDGPKDRFVWSKSFERTLTVENIFSVQQAIARNVAEAMQVEIAEGDDRLLSRIPTLSLDAYRAYQSGRLLAGTQSPHGDRERQRAIEFLDQAVGLDPNFADAYVELAWQYAGLTEHGDLPREDWIQSATRLAERALDLDPELAAGYELLGHIQSLARDYQKAEQSLRRAIELAPNRPRARYLYGRLLSEIFGRHNDGIAQLQMAVRLEPTNAESFALLAEAHGAVGQTEKALKILDQALAINATNQRVMQSLADVHGQLLGRLDEAIKWYTRALQANPQSVAWRSYLSSYYLMLEDPKSATRLCAEMQALAPENFRAQIACTDVLVYQERFDEALELALDLWLQRPYGRTRQVLGALYMRNRQFEQALAVYQRYFEEVWHDFPNPEERVTVNNYYLAVPLAAIRLGLGDRQRGNQLVEEALTVMRDLPPQSVHDGGVGFYVFYAHAVLGDSPNALKALDTAIRRGVRYQWWDILLRDPVTEYLHDDPQYQSLIAQIRQDLGRQRRSVGSMLQNVVIPKLPADAG
ncbi:MAG: tetratricopeptide repeat protein [Xanthomonadales bacterium]|nr:tetratricopeptide repeat protein [Xanthomonadales bacterium]